MLVAIDRATRYVWVKVLPRRTAADRDAIAESKVFGRVSAKVHTFLTDAPIGPCTKKGNPPGSRAGRIAWKGTI